MIRGIHYFSAEVKPKLMSSQGAALNYNIILKNRLDWQKKCITLQIFKGQKVTLKKAGQL